MSSPEPDQQPSLWQRLVGSLRWLRGGANAPPSAPAPDPVPVPSLAPDPAPTAAALPLLELLTRLRDAGLPLGLHEYQLALSALQAGFGLDDRAALKRLCRLLWVKSDEDAQAFDYHFAQLFERPAPRGDLPEPQPVARGGTDEPQPTAAAPATAQPMQELHVDQSLIQGQFTPRAINSRFVLAGEYLPVSRRQMKQSWRYWRRPVRAGPLEELDVEATIHKIGREGILLGPVLVARRSNRAALLLLLDQEGSMVPFHSLGRQIAETATRGGRLGQVQTYYFHNCPLDHLYTTASLQGAEPIDAVMARAQRERTGVLIFSDGGAARGGFNTSRATQTERFLQRVNQRIAHIAWLNPMPRARWIGTTASEIGQIVPMFEVSRRGLDQAIGVLRGRSTYRRGRRP